MPTSTSTVSSTVTSPTDAESNSASPREARSIKDGGVVVPIAPNTPNGDKPRSPEFTSLPPFPTSPLGRSKGFFSNLKASKSSNKVHHVEPTIRQVSEDLPRDDIIMSENPIYSMGKASGSTPDLSLATSMDNLVVEDSGGQHNPAHKVPRRPVGTSVASDTNVSVGSSETSQGKKPKPRLGNLPNLLTRSRSQRLDDAGSKSKPSTPIRLAGPVIQVHDEVTSEDDRQQVPPKTAPLRQDKSYRDMVGSSTRNRSADRQVPPNRSQENMPLRRGEKQSAQGLPTSSAVAYEGGVFTNIKSRAAGGLNKSKNFFGKGARSGSSNAKEVGPYEFCVIKLPLVQQTRRTRIAPRLADSKDKTEFWMPAIAWRCIDFLNFKGCEEEGLYRVPGSEVQIRHWQKRFDQEGDVNLFDEPELFDVNIIGSMFKAWLRELPTEIFPKVVQTRIARECAGATEVPQLLKDELSLLPPWNYYLLFAITCHLSLLVAYSEKNKMNFHNLTVCFQPALKIEIFCFHFLVEHWRKCWQGCWTEKEALDEEYRILDGGLPSSESGGSGEASSPGSSAVTEERSLASTNHRMAAGQERSMHSSSAHQNGMDEPSLGSSSSQQPLPRGRGPQARPATLAFTERGDEHLSTIYSETSETSSTPTATRFQHDRIERTSTHTPLPELAPVQPVSPIFHHFH